ncbi:MAG: hypothetical protein ABIQ13_16005 [Pedococcus sp.]
MPTDLLTPSRFAHGRRAVTIALAYVALVAVSVAYAAYYDATTPSVGASFSLMGGILLTAPLSLTLGGLPMAMGAAIPYFGHALVMAYGIVLGLVAWRVLRGSRLDVSPVAAQPAPC